MKLVIATAALFSISSIVQAESRNPVLDQAWYFSAGGYKIDADAEISTQSNVFKQRKFTVGLDDLGLDTKVRTYWLDAKWRPFERWSFMAEYFSYNETGDRSDVYSDSYDFTIKNTVFKGEAGINTQLDSEIDVDIFSLSAAYRLFDDQDYAVDLGFGLHTMDMSVVLEGSADIYTENYSVSTDVARESAEVLAPLPNIMLYGTYAFNESWALSGRAGWMSASYGDYSGELLRANASIEYRPIKSVGVGLGYNFSELNVERKQRFTRETFDIDFSGPLFYISGGF